MHIIDWVDSKENNDSSSHTILCIASEMPEIENMPFHGNIDCKHNNELKAERRGIAIYNYK